MDHDERAAFKEQMCGSLGTNWRNCLGKTQGQAKVIAAFQVKPPTVRAVRGRRQGWEGKAVSRTPRQKAESSRGELQKALEHTSYMITCIRSLQMVT